MTSDIHPSARDWRDYIDTMRVVLRARTGMRVANRAPRVMWCQCGRAIALTPSGLGGVA